jgi:hypothetical protein
MSATASRRVAAPLLSKLMGGLHFGSGSSSSTNPLQNVNLSLVGSLTRGFTSSDNGFAAGEGRVEGAPSKNSLN